MIGSILTICLGVSGLNIGVPAVETMSILGDRKWDRLPGADLKKALEKAAQLLGRRRVVLAGILAAKGESLGKTVK